MMLLTPFRRGLRAVVCAAAGCVALVAPLTLDSAPSEAQTGDVTSSTTNTTAETAVAPTVPPPVQTTPATAATQPATVPVGTTTIPPGVIATVPQSEKPTVPGNAAAPVPNPAGVGGAEPAPTTGVGDPSTSEPSPGETTTTSEGSTTTSSTSTEPTTTTTIVLGIDNGGDADVDPSDEVPKEIPNLPPAVIPALQSANLNQRLALLTREQQAAVFKAQTAADEATVKFTASEAELSRIIDEVAKVKANRDRVERAFVVTRETMAQRAISAYTGKQLDLLDLLVSSEDVSALVRRADLVEVVQHSDAELVVRFRSQKRQLADQEKALTGLAGDKQTQIDQLRNDEKAVKDQLDGLRNQLGSLVNGAQIALGGVVFPVQPPFGISGDFGAPRMTGTPFAHTHQGNDIFGTEGSPLRAITRGVLRKIGQNRLGGNRLWLIGQDGTAYYYAHLSAFVEGLGEGAIVEAGDVVGYLGRTGNEPRFTW